MLLTDQILGEVRRDIASFADPGSEVSISPQGMARWTRSRRTQTAQLIRRPGGGFPDAMVDGRTLEYQAFLSSEALADLKDLAVSILGLLPAPQHYVPAPARETGEDSSSETQADTSQLVIERTIDPRSLPIAATRVLFLHGNAGTGKTSSLIWATRLQAERYLRGETHSLFLYLDAQGKGLVQLEDVMARALQDLRAKFTYHSIAALTRRHCVVPVVDGFDELIGPSSAREAFANLAQFLAQLDCEGSIITSSRSAFIDYKTLYERAAEIAASQSLSYEIHPVEVLPWGPEAVLTFCSRKAPDLARLRERVTQLLNSGARSLISKPFFLNHIADIIIEGGAIDESGDIVGQVVAASLDREADKLKDSRGKPLLSVSQHRSFCQALAEEMWAEGRAELDTDTIRLLAELFASDAGLAGRDSKMLVDRSIAHGLLNAAVGEVDKRAFEHEVFQFEFLAGRVGAAIVGRQDALRDYLERAELPQDVVLRVPAAIRLDGRQTADAVALLSELAARATKSPFASVNAGSLVASLLCGRDDIPAGARLSGLYIRAHSFGSCQLTRATLRKCILERVDLSQAKFTGCAFEDTSFIACKYGDGTSFAQSAIQPEQVVGATVVTGDQTIEVYDPVRIRELLVGWGAPLGQTEPDALGTREASPAVSERIMLIERLLIHSRTHYYSRPDDVWVRNNLSAYPEWDTVFRLLQDHGLIESVKLQKSGRPDVFWRLTMPPDDIWRARAGGESQSTRSAAFWRQVAT